MHTLSPRFRSGSRLGRGCAKVLAGAALSVSLAGPVCMSLPATGQDIQKSVKSNEWYGEVRYYLTDETITIAKSATSDVKYDLADKKITFKIDPSIKTGSKVRVREQDLGSGKRLVSITPRSQ